MLYNLSKKSCLELCSPYQTDPIGSPKATINYKSARYDYNVYIIIIIYEREMHDYVNSCPCGILALIFVHFLTSFALSASSRACVTQRD